MVDGVNQEQLKKFIIDALHEDIQDGDHTSLACIPPNQITKAKLLVKDLGYIAGIDFAKLVFEHVDPNAKFTKFIEDGT